jgi:hypothetical protein
MSRPTAAALRALDGIQSSLKELERIHAQLPRDWQEILDRSSLAELDPIGMARLSNQLAETEDA